MLPMKSYKNEIVPVIGKTPEQELLLEDLKNFLNDNKQYTSFNDKTVFLKIKNLVKIELNDKICYGCMADMKEVNSSHNVDGKFYGKGYGVNEYPGSFNFEKEGYDVFIRKWKIRKIKEKLN